MGRLGRFAAKISIVTGPGCMAAPEHGCAGHQAGRPVPGAVPGPV